MSAIDEVTVEGINKGAGLLAYVEARPARPARTFAFGDSENDLPMLEAADVGVVMANARPHVIERVRELGGHVTAGVLDDGGRARRRRRPRPRTLRTDSIACKGDRHFCTLAPQACKSACPLCTPRKERST